MTKARVKWALVLALVVATWHFARAHTQLADFRITIEPSADGATLTCSKGCAWQTLSLTCDERGRPCKGEVDQSGVRRLK
jgi:hypothetical protein